MTSADPLFVDTNVLVYAADRTSPHHEASRRVRERGLAGDLNLCIAPQVLFEFYAVVTAPKRVTHPLSPEDATSEVAEYFANARIRKVHPGPDIDQFVLDLLRRYPVVKQRVFDLVLVATMLSNDITAICTFNESDFERFTEIEIVSPDAL